jgi:3-oxoacyl-ACP reductase-like protein
MVGNGTTAHLNTGDEDYEYRVQHLIMGANYAAGPIAALNKAGEALHEAATVFEGTALALTKIGSDTARALSDTVVIKRHLKAITEREQVLRRELDAIKAQLRKRAPRKGKPKTRKARKPK